MALSDVTSVDVRRRPRDRKSQILVAARGLFVEQGYPNVTMAQIAERVGITAGALYRHFNNKSVLLEKVVDASFAWVDEPLAVEDLGGQIEIILSLAADSPHLADLWAHEVRYLPEQRLHDLRRRMSAWRGVVAAALGRRRPDLAEEQTHVLAWAIQSLMSCLGRRALRAPMSLRVPAVRAAMHAVATAGLVPLRGSVANDRQASARLASVSVRERLLVAAFEQFAERGYSETTMASLGAVANVTGQNLYSYFESKADVLKAVIDRGHHALWLGLDDAFACSTTASEALYRLVENYIARAGSWIAAVEDPTGEVVLGETAVAAQREYVAEWIALLVRACPDLGAAEARVRVQLALFVISDLHGAPPLRRDAAFRENLMLIVMTILFDGAEVDAEPIRGSNS
ncbi:TetR family transcriptional regulator [Tamaricihabitans halophyticus]|uniref:TetR family transcriptional regulator n=1 Tax=Tamaricihabitans halophyticus TaxID=1262583 RepID=A0A4R2PYQ9_9PSEU|nr:TetR/AcrR family transcriptional regulator [Tamaricihabitans halophyticus]TCP41237.1 TetR family transcriptional regulator [Tamaricihabitans halophyticus]